MLVISFSGQFFMSWMICFYIIISEHARLPNVNKKNGQFRYENTSLNYCIISLNFQAARLLRSPRKGEVHKVVMPRSNVRRSPDRHFCSRREPTPAPLASAADTSRAAEVTSRAGLATPRESRAPARDVTRPAKGGRRPANKDKMAAWIEYALNAGEWGSSPPARW